MTTIENTPQRTKKCCCCGKGFGCSPEGNCWCDNYYIAPQVLAAIQKEYDNCLCPECLKLYAKKSL